MDTFRLESVRIRSATEKAFEYISDPSNLPRWTNAFKAVVHGKAIMATRGGTMEVGLQVKASASQGTIDWYMTFPDGSLASAFSRLVPETNQSCIYSFTLLSPPVPLEQLEGMLNQQAEVLREELTRLNEILSKT